MAVSDAYAFGIVEGDAVMREVIEMMLESISGSARARRERRAERARSAKPRFPKSAGRPRRTTYVHPGVVVRATHFGRLAH